MKRGEIYYIKSTYREEGSEQRGDRPAVIVSNNKNNEHSEVVEVVYMTTKPKTDLPTHVITWSTYSPSTILCEQVHTVSKLRVADRIATLSESELRAVDTALAISLGLNLVQNVRECLSDCHEVAPIMREPTEEELKKIAKEMFEKGELTVPAPEPATALNTEQTADLLHEAIKVQAERDVYKELYLNLLEKMKGSTN